MSFLLKYWKRQHKIIRLKKDRMDSEKIKALEKAPIKKLLIQYATPAIIAMVAASLYNLIDSIFIGHGVGALAISALALTFPLMNISAAIGSLIGGGGSTLLSVKLGQKDHKTAQLILGNVLIINVILGLLLSVVLLVFLNPILIFFGASEDTLPYAYDYMFIILIGNVITHLYFGLNAILRSSGHPKRSMQATILSVGINAVLDALFIFGFDWGIQGAAWATVIGQICGLIWQLNILRNPKELIHFKRGIYRLDWRLVKEMTSIGLSPFFMNLSSCVIIIAINQSLARTGGDMAIGAYGIINRIFFVAAMIVMGINQGMQPIAGYNYGARLSDRVMQVLRLSIIAATTITTSVFLAAQLYPNILAKMFTTDEELISIASQGMRLVCLVFPIVGFQMVTSIFFQSIGAAKKAIFLSLTRQLIFLLPGLLIFSRLFGTVGVWMSFPIADSLASLISAYMLRKEFRKFKENKVATI